MNKKRASLRDQLSLDDRQAAERKLNCLFRSFGIDASASREKLIDPYVKRAALSARAPGGPDVAALAVQEAETDLEDWFAALLGDKLEDWSTAVMIGRAAFLMCDGPTRWADQFLKPLESLDDRFVKGIADHAPSAVPPSNLGEMRHQPYDAWLPSLAALRAKAANGSLFQRLATVIRRDMRAASIRWRDTGPIS